MTDRLETIIMRLYDLVVKQRKFLTRQQQIEVLMRLKKTIEDKEIKK